MIYRIRFLLPLLIFIVIGLLLWFGLHLNPHRIDSPLLNKPLPLFRERSVNKQKQFITQKDFLGHITLLNVFATWCLSCEVEHPILMDIANTKKIKLIGLDYKDHRKAAIRWLQQYGNPYSLIIDDWKGLLGIDLGVYGTPETYLIDPSGIIRYKYIGPISTKVWNTVMLPQIKQLEKKSENVNAIDRYPFPDASQAKRFNQLIMRFRCLVCQNEDLASSEAPLASDLRQAIYVMVREGQSNRKIVNYMVDRYGDFVLFKPPFVGETYVLWFGPFVFLILAVMILFFVVRHYSRR